MPKAPKVIKDHFLRLNNSINLARNNKQPFEFVKEEIKSSFHNVVKKIYQNNSVRYS